MYMTIQGLVLRVAAYNDYDALLTVLTANHGKLTVKARGVRKKNSPLVATCQLLAFCEFTLFEYRGMYTVNEAHSIQLFSKLRNDLLKLSLATYFAQAAEVLCQEDLPNPELLSLVLNCLHALCTLELPLSQIKAVFELRSACIAGYTPELSGCHFCGNPWADRFDLSEGMLECSTCRNHESTGIRMPLNPGVADAMRYVCNCPPKRLFSFHAGTDTLEELSHISEGYLTTQLERGFSTLDFYKSLLIPIKNVHGLGE